MKNSILFIVSAALVFAFFLSNLPLANACGPFTVDPLFSFTKHGEYPLNAFAGGRVGVVPGTYGRMSLFVFYRHLNGLPFDADEQKKVVAALKTRIGIYQADGDNTSAENDSEVAPDYFENWKTARAKVLPGDTKIENEKQIDDSYQYFTNCLANSFKTAAKTLDARIAAYGLNENVKEWVKGQDAVFSNCGAHGAMPESLNGNYPEWLAKDRAYQIAAAKFYATDFPAATADFEQIAADANSAWNKTAKFALARTYIRQASLIEVSDKITVEAEKKAAEEQKRKAEIELLRNAEIQLRTILSDASMTDFHKSAQGLLNLVEYRSDLTARRKQLAETLSEKAENQNIYNDLTDYIWALETPEMEAKEKGEEIDRKAAEDAGKEYDYDYELKLRDLPESERADDLTDWLFTYQAQDGFAHAYEKWKQTRKLHWLVAAISEIDQNANQLSELLSEAKKIKHDSPAFATVRYHQIRLLLANDKRAEAKQLLNEVFSASFKNLPVSAQNDFFAERMIVAENLDEFLKFAQRRAATFVWSDDFNEEGDDLKSDKDLQSWTNRTMFDEDSVAFFNEKMPLSVLRQAALSPQLPEHLKRFLVIAVWTRAFALGNESVEREFTPLMSRYAPEFSPLFSKYANASNKTDREAAGLAAILSYPVIQPYVPVGYGREDSLPTTVDSNRGNWWCAEDKAGEEHSKYDRYEFTYPNEYPNFLTKNQSSEAVREREQLKTLGNSATFLARRAVEFANHNLDFRQTPEILHLAVRATRYGCGDKETTNYSKQAFTILHKRYPQSVWTKKTPFWF